MRTLSIQLTTVLVALATQASDAMLEQLKKHVREVDPLDYTIARRFIQSLALEAELPVS